MAHYFFGGFFNHFLRFIILITHQLICFKVIFLNLPLSYYLISLFSEKVARVQ